VAIGTGFDARARDGERRDLRRNILKAQLARTLSFSLSLAGCASIIGADFDELRLAPACETCTAGAGQGGGGVAGKSAESGSTSTGGAGDAGRTSPAGGSSATGGTGNVAPPDDGGEAGWAGEGGAPPDSCSTHVECIERHDDQPFICRRASCVPVITKECPVLLPRVGALDALKEEGARPMLIGGFANVEPPFFEDTASVNWDLALSEFHEGTWGGLKGVMGERRPLLAVVCNSNDADFMPALSHLTLDLGVEAVLSTLPPEKLLAAYEFTATEEYVEKRGELVFFLADDAADFRLENLMDLRLVWHMFGSPLALAVTTAGLVRHIERHVGEQRDLNALPAVDPPGGPLRLTLVTGSDLRLLDAESVLTAGDVQSPSSNLTFNGEYAVAQPGLFRRSGIDSAVEEILNNPPHIVVALAGPEIAEVIFAVESSWGESAGSQGFMRPFWVLYDSASHAAALPGTLSSLEYLSPPPSERLLGVSFARSQEEQAQLLYAAYQSKLFEFYQNERLSPILPGTQADYEAAYVLMYAYAAATPAGAQVKALDLRDALDRVVSTEPDAQSVSIGQDGVAFGTNWLRVFLEGEIALYGTTGAMAFKRSSGMRETGTSVWCLEPENAARPYVYDALLYDPGTDAFTAPASGIGSCAIQYEPIQN
jgi:hypothetical protein